MVNLNSNSKKTLKDNPAQEAHIGPDVIKNAVNISINKDLLHRADLIIENTRKALLDDMRKLNDDEVRDLLSVPDSKVSELMKLAHKVRMTWCGPTVELEGIVSAKTGACTENCGFCSQSSQFESDVKATPFLEIDDILQAAYETKNFGAVEFCLVLAVKGPDEKIMKKLEEIVPVVIEKTGLNVAVSAGILTEDQVIRLKACGVHRYNHNLETAKSFFANVATSHTYEERWNTCELILKHNIELCCGLLLGLGESDEQRVEALLQLRELGPIDVPLNFLNPRPGTPFENFPKVHAIEALKWIAIFRLGMPNVILRYAGGREVTLGDLQALGLESGINALIVGNYLTTLGRGADEDLKMLEELSMPVGSLTGVI